MGDPFDHLLEDNVADVRIHQLFAGRGFWGEGGDAAEGLRPAFLVVGKGRFRRQARDMDKKVAKRDGRFSVCRELGHVARRRFVQVDPALIGQDYDGGCGCERLG